MRMWASQTWDHRVSEDTINHYHGLGNEGEEHLLRQGAKTAHNQHVDKVQFHDYRHGDPLGRRAYLYAEGQRVDRMLQQVTVLITETTLEFRSLLF